MMKAVTLTLAAMTVCAGAAFAAPAVIAPQPAIIDASEIMDGKVQVSFDPADIEKQEDGIYLMKNVTIFTEDAYDLVDVARMEKGDTLTYAGNDIVVDTIERSGDYLNINGGFEEGGATLACREDSNGWVAVAYDDLTVYSAQCTVDLPLSAKVEYRDARDLTNDPIEINQADEAVIEMQKAVENYWSFEAAGTSMIIENGEVTAIDCVYTP